MAQTIGGYEVRGELGRGGMGVVYRGYDNKLERDVAIKVLESVSDEADALTMTSHHELVERFKTEAKAVAKLSHPNIVNIFDFGVENDKNYMVMEFLRGRDLSQLLRFNSPLSVELVVKAVIDVCAALDYAHTQGIIHRDIKPANIILLDNGITKLMDFGIARIQENQSQLTQAGTILGSVLYISPEQLISAQKVDKRADLYSLGVSMYELLTGRFPYDGDNVATIISKIMQSEPLPPSTYNPKISQKLDDIILKTIEKDPDKRFERASDLKEALNEVLYELKGLQPGQAGSSTQMSSTSFAKTGYAKSLEITLVEGVDKINLYTLIYRVMQGWNVENIGNKPILEALYGNENLSQGLVISDKVILLSYKGFLIGCVSNEPDEVGSAAYAVTADITKVDIKACIPSESQQEFLVIMSSILGSGVFINKHLGCHSSEIKDIVERAGEESFTGHMELYDEREIRYKGFIDGKEIFTLVMPNKNPSPNLKQNRTDIEIFEAKIKLFGSSLRRALIDTTFEIISKSHGSGATFKQLSLQKNAKILPNSIEESVKNSDIAVLVSNDKIVSLGKKQVKYSEIVQDFSASTLIKWLMKDLLVRVSRSRNFGNLKNTFSWIWNLKTIKLSQQVKLNDGKSLSFDLVTFDNIEKISVLGKYGSQSNVSELHTFVENVILLTKNTNNSDVKAALYISGEDFSPEVMKYYDKIVKKESFLSFASPKSYVSRGSFNLFLIKEEINGYKLILPEI